MEHSPSWEANMFSASQEIPRILRNPKVHYRIHNSPPPALILSHIASVHSPHPTSWRSILILSSHLRLGLPSDLFPSGSPTKPYTRLSPSPYALHAPLISFFSILSSEQYWVRSTDHLAPQYVVFFPPLSPRPSWAQIFSSTPYSQTPSAYVPPSMSATKFHTHTKQQAKL